MGDPLGSPRVAPLLKILFPFLLFVRVCGGLDDSLHITPVGWLTMFFGFQGAFDKGPFDGFLCNMRGER